MTAARHDRLDTRNLWKRLRATVEGDVRFDPGSRGLYAQDASNYYHVPIGVVLPRSADDVLATLAACREHGAPVVPRTGGTALAGQTCNEAVVLDFSRYMHRVVAIDVATRTARVEPGVVCDELTDAVKAHGLTWGPKPATHSRCGFGGMIANNCGGMNAQYAGTAVHNVEALEVALYDGTRMPLGWMSEADLATAIARGDPPAKVLGAVRDLRDRYASRIRAGFPRLPRRVSGYNLDQLLPAADGRFNLARALVGTEGTCATTLEATVRLVALRPRRVVVLLGYEDIFRAGDAVPAVLAAEPDPMAIEGMDQRLYDNIRTKAPPHAKYLDLLPKGHGWLFVQIGSETKAESVARGEQLAAALRADVVDVKVLDDDADQEHLWAMREDSLGATAFVRGERDTWEGWEDSAVPPARLGAYLRDLDGLLHEHGLNSVLYGHFGQGLVHCRIDFELTSAPGVGRFRAFLSDAADLVGRKYGGSLSGEHGDGQSKAEFLEAMFGPELVRAFAEFKEIWDPAGKMNPGKVVRPHRADADLRLGVRYDPMQPKTHFAFPADAGSFSHATLRCVGVGKCRNLDSADGSVMCPSYMVTREERYSTRGRAHLLWEMMRGEGPVRGGFANGAVKESLDLCLACKGCKSDCPVNVDVATYKAEFLSHYYESHLRPRQAYAFGWIDRWAALAAFAPRLVNVATQAPVLRSLAKAAAGVHGERSIPPFARETFQHWFASHRPRAARSESRVVLWADTFNNYFHPETARDAVRVLEHLGFSVIVPRGHLCCGRPLYDFGMLDRAKKYLERTLAALRPHVDAGTPMIVLEPSCCSVFRDELGEMMPNRNEAKNLRAQTFTLAEFLRAHVDEARLPRLGRKALVQRHCHHHAVMRFDADEKVFSAMGLDWEVLRSGCCGMAGSFGFEKDKYEVSRACGERVLLPRVRKADDATLIMADGFSCRTQIAQGSPREAIHLAQALAMGLDAAEPPGRQGRMKEILGNRSLTGTPAVAVTAAALACVYVLSTLPTPLYVDYRRAFGFSQIMLTVAYAVYVVGSMATMFFFGRLSDQIGRRPVVLVSLGLSSVAGLLFLAATDVVWLLLARIVSGLAIALASGASTAWIVELHPRGDKRRASQIAIGANLFGLGAGALLAGLLAQYAWAPLRLAYVVFLASLPVVVACAWQCTETVRATRPLGQADLRPRLGVPGDLRRAFAFPAIGAFATFSVLGFYAALLPSLLTQSFRDTDHAHAGVIVGCLFFVGVLAVAITANVRARNGTIAGLAMLLPGIGLLVLAQAVHSIAILLLGTAFAGAGGGLGYCFGIQVVNEIAPDDRRSEMVSAYLIVCYVAISLPVIGLGVLAAASSLFVADSVFAIVVALVAVAALLVGLRPAARAASS